MHWVDQAWRVFCYSCTPTYYLADQFTVWKAAERFFAEFFDFLFDNTSTCYLVFVFFFPTLLTFILLLIFDEYGLEQFYCLFARIYSYSALSLNQSKNNRVVTFNWRSKQALVFIHKSELLVSNTSSHRLNPSNFLKHEYKEQEQRHFLIKHM